MEQLSVEFVEIKSLFQACQLDAKPVAVNGLSSPLRPELAVEKGVLSLAASASHFLGEEEEQSSRALETGSFLSSRSTASGSGAGSMQDVICMALT